MKNPPFMWGFVKTEIIEPLGLPVTNAAQVLGVTRPALSAFLNERASLSPDMAIRMEIAQARTRYQTIDVARHLPDAAAAE